MNKAVILARGLGTRMRKKTGARLERDQAEAAGTGIKAMIPVGRPFLDYVISGLADAGYRHVCLVVGPEPVFDRMRSYYSAMPCRRVKISFAVQARPLGTADAVAAAEAFAGGDPFLVINSDNYYPAEALELLRGLRSPGLAVFERGALREGGNIPPERIAGFAVVESAAGDSLSRIIEKPGRDALRRITGPVYVSMNCWRFGPFIFRACRRVMPSPRGELELTDAVQYAVDSLGVKFRVVRVSRPVLDLTGRGDIAPVADHLRGVKVLL